MAANAIQAHTCNLAEDFRHTGHERGDGSAADGRSQPLGIGRQTNEGEHNLGGVGSLGRAHVGRENGASATAKAGTARVNA